MRLSSYRPILIPMMVIITALISLVLILPRQLRALTAIREKIDQLKEEVEELRSKYLLLSSLDKNKLSQQARLAVSALPEDKKVPYLLQGVREALAENKLVIKSLKLAPGEIAKPGESQRTRAKTRRARIERLPIAIEAVGRSEDLEALFRSIENRLPLFEINSFEAMISRDESGIKKVTIKMKLSTFYSPPLAPKQISQVSLDDLILTEKEQSLLESLAQFKVTQVKASAQTEGNSEREDQPVSPSGRENPFKFD